MSRAIIAFIKILLLVCKRPIVHPGMAVHFDPPSLNIHCEGVVGPRNFKLGGVIEKSYGFTFVGPVSMETLLSFERAVFVKILTSPTSIIFPSYHIFS